MLLLTIHTDDELAAMARATWTPLADVYRDEAAVLDVWAQRSTGPDAERAARRARQLRERVPALCTLDRLGAEVEDPDLEADLDADEAAA